MHEGNYHHWNVRYDFCCVVLLSTQIRINRKVIHLHAGVPGFKGSTQHNITVFKLIWSHTYLFVPVDLQEQESAQVSEQRCAQLEKDRRELERQLSGLSDRLEEEEACSAQLTLHRDRLEAECSHLRRDLDKVESALSAVEQARQVQNNSTLLYVHYRIQSWSW